MPTPDYEKLLAAKHQDVMAQALMEALRAGTDLRTTLGDFIKAVTDIPNAEVVLQRISLGDIFEAVVSGSATTPRHQAATGARDTARRKKVTKTRSAGPGRRRGARTDPKVVTKRLATIVFVLEKSGDWMRPKDIHAAAISTNESLFRSVNANLFSQYLGKLLAAKPPRVQRMGKRPLTVYRVV